MLKTFTSFLLNENKSKHLVFVLGRFQPATIGHEKIVNAAFKISRGIPNSEFAIYTTRTHDRKSNPLDTALKIKALRESFSNLTKKISDVISAFTLLNEVNNQYDNVTFIVGSDRVSSFKTALEKYNGKPDFYSYESINVISGGERDPDATDVTGVSGTKVRQFAKDNDYESFRKSMPTRLSERTTQEIFNQLRK